MATYTVSGSRLVCTGTDITSAGLKSAIDSNPSVGTATEIVSSNNSRATYIFNAEISIGDNNTASVWNPQNEFIQIIADQFIVNGNNAELRTGKLDTNSKAENVVAFCYASSNSNYDRFKLQNGGNLTIYGGFFAVTGVNSSRGRIGTSANSTVVIQDADLEIEDGIGTAGGSSLSGHTINYKGCRFHHTSAVGVKLYNPTSATLEKVKIESCTYAIQPGATPLVLRDLEVDSCTFHIVPNLSNSDMTFINPDFLTLRAAFSNSSDITRIAFRYDFKVTDSSGSAMLGSEVYITDQTGSVVVNTTTDVNGIVNSSLPTYDGTVCLQNSTFAGNTKTNREEHARSVYKYGFLPKTDTITINQDTKDFVALLPDSNITEPNKTTVDAYTDIDTVAKFYDRTNSYLEDNFGTYLDFIVTRSGNQIDAGSYNVTIDATASSAFDITGNLITIKASTFTGDMVTTGLITLANGATFDGVRTDANGTVYPDQPISITNISAGSRLRIYNVTTGTETVNTVVSGTSYTSSYQEGTGYNDGDTVRVYLTKLGKQEWVGDVIDTSNGFNVLASQVDDDVYTALGVDGTTITKFQADYVNNEVDLVIGSDWTMAELYAWWANNLTTEDGIRNFFGGITAIDQANFRINTSIVDLYLDNTTNASYKQTDNRRFFRDTGTGYPVRNPTTSGYGLDVVWRNTILIAESAAGGTSDLNFYDVKRAVKQVITNPKYIKGQK